MYKDKTKEMLVRIDKAIMEKQSDSKEFLIEYVKQWKYFTIFVATMNRLFQYLDNFHLKNQGANSLAETALELFRDQIFKGRPSALRTGILQEVKKDRDGQVIDHQQVKVAVGQYIYMGYEPVIKLLKKTGETEYSWQSERRLDSYNNDYEKYLLEETTTYYKAKAREWSSSTCFDYVLKVQKALRKEEENADLWYDS